MFGSHQPGLRRADLHRHRDPLRPRRQDHDRRAADSTAYDSRDGTGPSGSTPDRRSRAAATLGLVFGEAALVADASASS
jgi:hypothetical protein